MNGIFQQAQLDDQSDRSRRFIRRKNVGVIIITCDNDNFERKVSEWSMFPLIELSLAKLFSFIAQEDMSCTSPETETEPDMHTRHYGTRPQQRVIDISCISRAYQESATVRYRRQFQWDQHMSQSKENGCVVVSAKALSID
jgi:hypothetical protein